MTKHKGFCWHVHHDKLLEWCFDYDKRADFIRRHKPKDEIPIRLEWMLFVKGKLPADLCKAGQEFDAANDKSDVARRKHAALEERCLQGRKKYVVALHKWMAAIKKRDVVDDKLTALLRLHKKRIEALHKKECPNCPWDGRRLVFEKVKND